MIKNGEKTEAYLMLSKDVIDGDKISIQTEDEKTKIVAATEDISEVKVLIDILNDEEINGCIVDYSDILSTPTAVGGLTYVDDYMRSNGTVTFFSSKDWNSDLDEIIDVKHKVD